MKTVGVIGGVGPETTAGFYLEIVFSCQRKSRTSRPGVIISSVPLPYQIEDDLVTKNIGGDRYIPFLTAEAKRLEKAGADFIVMPCNTIHIFIDDVRRSVNIPVLSIIEETVKFIKAKGYKRVGLLATTATIQHRLYQSAFEQEGIEYVVPDEFQQSKMGSIILNLVTGHQNERDRADLFEMINDFEGEHVDCVALACTDLQLLVQNHPNLEIFDTMKILADATVKEVLDETIF